jgi:hypothetical protein
MNIVAASIAHIYVAAIGLVKLIEANRPRINQAALNVERNHSAPANPLCGIINAHNYGNVQPQA